MMYKYARKIFCNKNKYNGRAQKPSPANAKNISQIFLYRRILSADAV